MKTKDFYILGQLSNRFVKSNEKDYIYLCKDNIIVLKIAHIINPFHSDSNHKKIQDLTFESIRNARNYENNNDVLVYCVYFKEDIGVIPDFCDKSIVIDDSIQNYYTESKKKLPLLRTLFEDAFRDKDVDYIVYTNIDIGLNLQFYSVIKQFIDEGMDAFAINRRRVNGKYNNITDLNQIYGEVGKIHTGYDCFVFKRELINKFQLGNVCIGIPFVDSILLFNLIAYADNFKLFTNKHLTFHVGFDLVKAWGAKGQIAFNKVEYLKALKRIKKDISIKNIPGSGLPFLKRHFKWLMNPTIHYPTVAALDFKASNKKRYRQSDKGPNGYYEWLQNKINLD